MTVPAISVLLPVYNGSAYLSQCLSSITRQQQVSLEIICIDDGSTDNSWQILQTAAQQDPRMRIVHQENQGISATRNRLLEMARGKYVAFIDADDWVEASYFERLYEKAEQEQADITKCWVKHFDHKTSSFFQDAVSLYAIQAPGNALRDRFLSGFHDATVWGKLWRLDFIRLHGMSFLPNYVAEDLAFIVWGSCVARHIAVVPEKLYVYRRAVSGSITSNAEKILVGRAHNLLFIRRLLEEQGYWTPDIAGVWIWTMVWEVCSFRKFDRKQHAACVQQLWQSTEPYVNYCRGGYYIRWKILFMLVRLCGLRSVFLWTKLFRGKMSKMKL